MATSKDLSFHAGHARAVRGASEAKKKIGVSDKIIDYYSTGR